MKIEEHYLLHLNHFSSYIENHLIEIKEQKDWETTSLVDETATVYYYHFNNMTRDFLKENSESFFNWLYPSLPEDLMFYYNDICLLAVCSHERYFLVEEIIWQQFERL